MPKNVIREVFTGRIMSGFDTSKMDDGIPVVMMRSGKMLDAPPARFVSDAIAEKIMDVYVGSGRRKMFKNHQSMDDMFSGTPRDPGDWIATLEGKPEIRQLGDVKVVVDKMRLLGGNEARAAFKESILQAPDEIQFSVEMAVTFDLTKVDGELVFNVQEVHDFYSLDWVTEAATGMGLAKFNKLSLEEIMVIDLEKFKTLFPEEWAKAVASFAQEKDAAVAKAIADTTLAVEGTFAVKLSAAVEDAKKGDATEALTAEVVTLKAKIVDLTAENAAMKAEKSAGVYNAAKEKIESVRLAAVEKSGIPANFQANIIALPFDISKFISAEGVADVDGFTAAYAPVVAEWEGKFGELPLVNPGKGKEGFSKKGEDGKTKLSPENEQILKSLR